MNADDTTDEMVFLCLRNATKMLETLDDCTGDQMVGFESTEVEGGHWEGTAAECAQMLQDQIHLCMDVLSERSYTHDQIMIIGSLVYHGYAPLDVMTAMLNPEFSGFFTKYREFLAPMAVIFLQKGIEAGRGVEQVYGDIRVYIPDGFLDEFYEMSRVQ